MSTVPSEMIKKYLNSQKINITTEIMAVMKEMFKYVLQQVTEIEL